MLIWICEQLFPTNRSDSSASWYVWNDSAHVTRQYVTNGPRGNLPRWLESCQMVCHNQSQSCLLGLIRVMNCVSGPSKRTYPHAQLRRDSDANGWAIIQALTWAGMRCWCHDGQDHDKDRLRLAPGTPHRSSASSDHMSENAARKRNEMGTVL